MASDPATGRPLPDHAIQRVLFIANNVHVYQIPPLTSTKGFSASSWTSPTQPTAQEIFTARLRVIETSIDSRIKADIVLEDADLGDLFAAAPYTSAAVVQSALDSSRFFAVRVQGEGGMKATLGVGFEDRSPAFDFGIALADVRKVMAAESGDSSAPGRAVQPKDKPDSKIKQDFSLKEGEKIHIQLGPKKHRQTGNDAAGDARQDDGSALFSIAPPPPAANVQTDLSHANPSQSTTAGKSARDLGFDDGEFGEFQ